MSSADAAVEVDAANPATPPKAPHALAQRWHNLLFAHYPFRPADLARFIPEGLVLDTYDEQAWLGIVPFRMSGVRLRGTPALPWLSAFPELNVRTYARTPDGRHRGVVFLSLDAANPVAVHLARLWYRLPYFRARMGCTPDPGDPKAIRYSSHRTHLRAPSADLSARYRPTGPAQTSVPGTLEHFLTERYYLFTRDRSGRALEARVHHEPWPLQTAEAEFERDSMAAAHGLRLPDTAPLLHFARELSVVAWAPTPVGA